MWGSIHYSPAGRAVLLGQMQVNELEGKEGMQELREEGLSRRRKFVDEKLMELKIETFLHYGGVCTCCGEYKIEFLTLEHPPEYRGVKGPNGKWVRGWQEYARLRAEGYPPGPLVHCMNCNWAKRYDNECPHDRQRRNGGGPHMTRGPLRSLSPYNSVRYDSLF